MPVPAIRVSHLSKRYQLGLTHAGSIRELASRWTDRLLGRSSPRPLGEGQGVRAGGNGSPPTSDLRPPTSDSFWALKDVSFDVQPGEVLGIIGRNGAGKSTLLKILSRITAPTEGRVEINGRVASLLEVGTGFHPELTGRENVYLNGAILGMTKPEIRSKFDEIVAFSEIERFIDTPVKRYSSGMYVRLAFAVAAHLEPEILVVDEVLAVGDAVFQRKCLGKMGEVARGGRTILFVSHNMDAVKRLCRSGVLLQAGTVKFSGGIEDCVSELLLAGLQEGGHVVFTPPRNIANGMPVTFCSVQLSDLNGNVKQLFSAGEPIRVRLKWQLATRLYKPRIGFVLMTADGTEVLTALDAESWNHEWQEAGPYVSECVIPGQLLNEGRYVVDFGGDAPGRFDWTQGRTGPILQFEVEDDMTLPNKYYGEEGFRDARWPGLILAHIPWKQTRDE